MGGLFKDRAAAGRALAAEVVRVLGPSPAPLVLGVPRGGVVVAAEVARAIGARLMPLVVVKVRAPEDPEYALGAVGPGGGVWLARQGRAMGPRVASLVEAARAEQARRERVFAQGAAPVTLAGAAALLVDDGIATGQTALAALRTLRAAGCSPLVLAAPVAPRAILPALGAACDRVVLCAAPEAFPGVGAFYQEFGDVDDDEVRRILRTSPPVDRGRQER